MPRSRPYRIGLNQRLKDPIHAAAYLNSAKSESRDVFLLALRDVVQAHKVSKIAAAAGLNRESLYRALSSRGNPSLTTLDGILAAIGIDREYQPRRSRSRKRNTPFPAVAEPTVEVRSATVGSAGSASMAYQSHGLVFAVLPLSVLCTGQMGGTWVNWAGENEPVPAYPEIDYQLQVAAAANNQQSGLGSHS